MKLIKIDGYWIIVSKQEILPNSWYENNGMLFLSDNKYNEGNNPNSSNPKVTDHNFKLIYSQNPEHNLPSITFSDEVAKKLGIVDVEKLVDKLFKDEFKLAQESMPAIWYDIKLKAIKLYNQALSDNKDKLFTLEDMGRAYRMGKTYGTGRTNLALDEDTFIQFLTKQEYDCELEMEMKYEDCLEGSEFILRPAYKEPKLSSGSVKVIKLIK
jgi:hypothetical protein